MRIFPIRSFFIPLIAMSAVVWASSAPHVLAQEPPASPTREARQLDVHAESDGRLVVVALNAPIDEVIRAVATKAGLEVSAFGPIPHDPTTVSFPVSPAHEILTTLLNSADINYILTGGPAGRLIMVMFPPRPGLPERAAESAIGQPSVAAPAPTQESEVASAPAFQPPVGPTEWPLDIEPAGPSVSLPQTREALFMEVNGSAAVRLPADATPNVGPPRRPEDFEPVNRPSPTTPTTPLWVPSTASRPGPVAAGATGLSAAPTTPPPAPSPEMLKAPRTIQVPAPVVIEFPPPLTP